MIPYILTPELLTLVINNSPYNINKQHLNYEAILNELRGQQDPDTLLSLIDVPKTIADYINKDTNELIVDLAAGLITFNGSPIDGVLVDRILDMYQQGFDVTPMVMFLKNLYQNSSNRAITELYSFLEYGKLPITEDGHFLAYKRVNNDYTSVFDRTTLNAIGTTVSMPREQVNSNSDVTCSSGLHFCSHEYLSSYSGARVLILKVNPRDVVSIPTDYNNTKARACQYEVIGELNKVQTDKVDNKEPVFTAAVVSVVETPTTPVKPEKVKSVKKLTKPKAVRDTSVYAFYQAAYTLGYNTGKHKQDFDESPVEAGATVIIAGGKAYILGIHDAIRINAGYTDGYKDGKGHKKRRVPQFQYTDITDYVK